MTARNSGVITPRKPDQTYTGYFVVANHFSALLNEYPVVHAVCVCVDVCFQLQLSKLNLQAAYHAKENGVMIACT